MRRSVSSPHETLRRELKIRPAAEYFWRTTRCFLWWWNIVSNAWYCFSNKMILEGEIKDAKWAVSHLVSKHSLIDFLCVFFMNYYWVWEVIQTVWATENYVEKKICTLWDFLKKTTDAVLYLRYSERVRSICLFVI